MGFPQVTRPWIITMEEAIRDYGCPVCCADKGVDCPGGTHIGRMLTADNIKRGRQETEESSS